MTPSRLFKHWRKHRQKSQIVYDDDATALIQSLLRISYDPRHTPFLFHDGYAEYKKYGFWLSHRFMHSYRLHNYDFIDVEGEINRHIDSDYVKVSKLHGFKTLSRDWKIPEEVESMKSSERAALH